MSKKLKIKYDKCNHFFISNNDDSIFVLDGKVISMDDAAKFIKYGDSVLDK